MTDLRRKSHLPTICQLFANCPGDPVQMQPGRSAPRLPTPSPKEADRAQAKSPHHHSGLAPSHIRANQIIAGKRIQTHRKSRRACLTILESQFQAPRDTSQRADRRTRKEARKVDDVHAICQIGRLNLQYGAALFLAVDLESASHKREVAWNRTRARAVLR